MKLFFVFIAAIVAVLSSTMLLFPSLVPSVSSSSANFAAFLSSISVLYFDRKKIGVLKY